MYDLRALDLSAAGVAACAELLSRVFGKPWLLTPPYVDWEYNQNPAGPAIGSNAWVGDTLAAHYGMQPLEAIVGGRPRRGLLSLNTATHPDHQGKKLFARLAELSYERAAALGYQFVVGVANASSTPGFVTKLGFLLVSPLHARVGVGGLPATSQIDAPDFRRIWTAESLRWRLSNPTRRYMARRGGCMTTVLSSTEWPGVRAHLLSFESALLPDDGLPAVPLRPSVRLWIGLGETITKGGWYAEIPTLFRPSPLNLIFKDLTGAGVTMRPELTHFRLGDFDAY